MHATLRVTVQRGSVDKLYIQDSDFPTMEHSFRQNRIYSIAAEKKRSNLSPGGKWRRVLERKVVIPVSLFIFLERPPKLDSNDSVRSINEVERT
jgi:hypothetical protein